MTNLLKNPGFEGLKCDPGSPPGWCNGNYTHDTFNGNIYSEIVTPQGWVTAWSEGKNPFAEGNYRRPECKVIPLADPFIGPPLRIRSGKYAVLQFGFEGAIDSGLYQVVNGLIPGAKVSMSAWAQAWKFSDPWNMLFRVGIDPSGGTDMWSPSVIWSNDWDDATAWPQDVYGRIGDAIATVGSGGRVTVFLRATSKWAFRNTDAYWDDAELVYIDAPDPPDSPVPPIPPSGTGIDPGFPVVLAGSKLGVHTIWTNNVRSYLQQSIDYGQPMPIIKSVDDIGQLEVYKTMAEDGIATIGRIGNIAATDDELDGDLAALARRLMKPVIAANKIHGAYVDYWEVTNEMDPPSARLYGKFADLHWEMMVISEVNNMKLALFSLNAGTPEYDEIVAMVETGVFKRAKEGGHIMAVHEGVFRGDPINKWWNEHNVDANGNPTTDKEEMVGTAPGGWIPGGPVLEWAGALCFRYRFLYDLLIKRGEVIPLVITEWYAGGHERDKLSPADIVERFRWYDLGTQYDAYVWGICPFTLGPPRNGTWVDHDYEWAYQALLGYAEDVKDIPNVVTIPPPNGEEPLPPGPGPEPTHVRKVVLEPQEFDLKWKDEVTRAVHSRKMTITQSAEDAGGWGVGIFGTENTVYAVNPQLWSRDDEGNPAPDQDPNGVQLSNWFTTNFHDSKYVPIFADSPIEAFLALSPMIEPGNVWQRNSRWAFINLGGPVGTETIGSDGCVLCCICDILQDIGGYPAYPDKLNEAFHKEGAYVNDDLMNWARVGELFSVFDWHSRSDLGAYSSGTLRTLLDNDFYVICALDGGSHYVVLTDVTLQEIVCRDPWYDEAHMVHPITRVTGVRLYKPVDSDPVIVPRLNVRGMHGAPITGAPPSGDWQFWTDEMKAMNVKWYKSLSTDVSWLKHLISNDITPIVRLYQGQKYPGRLDRSLMEKVPSLVKAGVRFIESENEPNLTVEWKSEWRDRITWQDPSFVRLVLDDWIKDAREIISYGAYASFPALGPTDVNGVNDRYSSVKWAEMLVRMMYESYRAEVSDWIAQGKLWVAVHSVAMNRPFDFDPWTPPNFDDMCLRGYEFLYDRFGALFGAPPEFISTEGGLFSPEHLNYLGWAPYSEGYWTTAMPAMFKYIQEETALAGLCQWILTDQGVGDPNWKDNGLYKGKSPRPVVASMKTR